MSIDLLTVTNTTATAASGNHNDLLEKLGGYIAHRPYVYVNTAGDVTNLSYNAWGQLTRLSPPAPPVYSFNYDAGKRLSSIGLNPTSPSDPGQIVSSFTYDNVSRRQTSTDATGQTMTYAYDAADRPKAITYPDSTSVAYGYTLLDRTTVTDRMGNLTTTIYDAHRKPTSVTRGSRTHGLSYYPDDTLATMTDPRGSQTIFVRDLEGRLTKTIYPTGDSQLYAWDEDGRLKSDPIASYQYDSDGALLTATSSNGDQTSYVYDPAYPRVTTLTEAVGGTSPPLQTQTRYAYWPFPSPGGTKLGANQLSTVTTVSSIAAAPANAAMNSVSYAYDHLGRATQMGIGFFASSLSSFPLANVSTTTTPDSLGRTQTVQNTLDTFQYGYSDLSRRVTSVTSSQGPLESITYQPLPADPLLSTITYASASGSTSYGYGYNSNAQVVAVSVPQSLTGAPSATFSYDAWGEVTSAARLATPTGNGFGTYSYGYDGNGNRTSSVYKIGKWAIAAWSFAYDADDRVTSSTFDSAPPAYDANGNPTSLGGASYTFDGKNRIRSFTKGSLTSTSYYDGVGHLVHFVDQDTSSGTQLENFLVWCGDRVCARHDASGHPIAAYYPQGFTTYIAGTALPNQSWYYSSDLLGSPGEIIAPASAGGSTETYDFYDTFGAVSQLNMTSPAVQADIGFAGYFYHSASGLYFTEHRAYNPQYGRWLTRDPIGITGGWNLYEYANNDPQSRYDRSGLDPVGAAIGASIGGSVGGWFLGAAGATAGAAVVGGEVVTIPAGAIGGFVEGASWGALAGGAIGDVIGDWINLEARGEQSQIKRWAQLTGATKEQVGNAIEAVKKALGLGPRQNVDDVQPNGDIIKDGDVVGNVHDEDCK